jgi:hypothetical protein
MTTGERVESSQGGCYVSLANAGIIRKAHIQVPNPCIDCTQSQEHEITAPGQTAPISKIVLLAGLLGQQKWVDDWPFKVGGYWFAMEVQGDHRLAT